jgi:tRNA nucleotidyltransferase (CCA-adding enzyme)
VQPAGAGSPPGSEIAARIPPPVLTILERLWSAGFEAWVVGGSLRDILLGREVADWDIATSALPEQTERLFPGSVYENRFGTVGVRHDEATYEVTTFRREHVYADHRRPERVDFGASVDEDLARRDFTMNAIAWGGRADGPRLHDPFDGSADLAARIIRAVGNPDERFAEDALRMLRAVRFAATLGFEVDSETLAAIERNAASARFLSGERVGAELRRILAAPVPSVALRLMERTHLLDAVLPELAAQRGIAQNKVAGADLWDHTVATVDAVPPERPAVRLAGLLHDVAKPATLRDGHFPDHDREGATMAEQLLRRLASPRRETARVAALVGHHMFDYSAAWSDAAVRRFIRRVGVSMIDDLLALREADNVGSGLPRDAGDLAELRARVTGQLDARPALALADLAIDGDDVRAALGIDPGPEVGRILEELLERVLADPALNDRGGLIEAAREIHQREDATEAAQA